MNEKSPDDHPAEAERTGIVIGILVVVLIALVVFFVFFLRGTPAPGQR